MLDLTRMQSSTNDDKCRYHTLPQRGNDTTDMTRTCPRLILALIHLAQQCGDDTPWPRSPVSRRRRRALALVLNGPPSAYSVMTRPHPLSCPHPQRPHPRPPHTMTMTHSRPPCLLPPSHPGLPCVTTRPCPCPHPRPTQMIDNEDAMLTRFQ